MDFSTLSLEAGRSFLVGYSAGFVGGSILGMAENIDELPAIRLNQTLNKGFLTAHKLGYNTALGTVVHKISMSQTRNMNPIASHAIAGGATGTVLGMNWGWKGAAAGGAAGAALGALYAASKDRVSLEQLLQ